MTAAEEFLKKKSVRALEYIGILNEMFESPEYDYAFDTLSGIMDWVSDNNAITDKQVQAIENIKSNPSLRHHDDSEQPF